MQLIGGLRLRRYDAALHSPATPVTPRPPPPRRLRWYTRGIATTTLSLFFQRRRCSPPSAPLALFSRSSLGGDGTGGSAEAPPLSSRRDDVIPPSPLQRWLSLLRRPLPCTPHRPTTSTSAVVASSYGTPEVRRATRPPLSMMIHCAASAHSPHVSSPCLSHSSGCSSALASSPRG